MRILLTYKSHAAGAKDPYTALLPVGLGYLNAILRQHGFSVKLANLSGFSWTAIKSLLTAEQPEVLGVSQFTHNRFESIRLAELAKQVNPRCRVVFGGPHATHCYDELLLRNPAIDAVVIGEGEETLLELVDFWRKGNTGKPYDIKGVAFLNEEMVVKTSRRLPVADLDALPQPAAELDNSIGVDIYRQSEFIITSRGCPSACVFCASPNFWGKALRFRSPRSIVEEIRSIRDQYGLLYFSIRDDTFTADRQRVLDFCRLLLHEKIYILWNCQSRVSAVDDEVLGWMKRAGCECVQFGVESGSQRILASLGKRITPEQVLQASASVRKAGINLSIYLITGVPGEDEKDLAATQRLVKAIRPHDGQVSPLAYYPGTALFARGVDAGEVASDVFATSHDEGLFVRSDQYVSLATEKLLASLHMAASVGRFRLQDFAAQRKYLGYCHATNIMAGEYYVEEGRHDSAEKEYREIVEREPENPWGWLMLGELSAELGNYSLARKSFEEVIALVPAHAAAYSLLGEVLRCTGDKRGAENLYLQALGRNPGEELANRRLKGNKIKK